MSCEVCRQTFLSLETPDQSKPRALRLDEAEPCCRCQTFSVSKFSSGPVENQETLIRILVAPQHWNKKTRRPKQASLSSAETSGLSICRESQVTDEQLRRVAEQLVNTAKAANNGQAGVFGVLLILCETVRNFQLETDDSPSYCVYDTGESSNPSHAEAFQRVDQVKEQDKLNRRAKLFELLQNTFVPVSSFRGGLLSDLAPP